MRELKDLAEHSFPVSGQWGDASHELVSVEIKHRNAINRLNAAVRELQEKVEFAHRRMDVRFELEDARFMKGRGPKEEPRYTVSELWEKFLREFMAAAPATKEVAAFLEWLEATDKAI